MPAEDLQGKESQHRALYFDKLKKDDQSGKWLIYGDHEPFGAIIQSIYGNNEWGPWTGVWVGVKADRWDPNQGPVSYPITSVHLGVGFAAGPSATVFDLGLPEAGKAAGILRS